MFVIICRVLFLLTEIWALSLRSSVNHRPRHVQDSHGFRNQYERSIDTTSRLSIVETGVELRLTGTNRNLENPWNKQ
jgi:hypothetical protein